MPVTTAVGINGFTSWPQYVTVPDATPTAPGVMSASDKAKLDDISSSGPLIPNTQVALSDAVTKSLFTVDMTLCPDNSFGCIVYFSAESTDGSNVQIRTGFVNANLALKSGSYTTGSQDTGTTTVTAGSLQVTFSWSGVGTVATFQVNVNSSLVPTDLHINFYVPFATHPNAVALA